MWYENSCYVSGIFFLGPLLRTQRPGWNDRSPISRPGGAFYSRPRSSKESRYADSLKEAISLSSAKEFTDNDKRQPGLRSDGAFAYRRLQQPGGITPGCRAKLVSKRQQATCRRAVVFTWSLDRDGSPNYRLAVVKEREKRNMQKMSRFLPNRRGSRLS